MFQVLRYLDVYGDSNGYDLYKYEVVDSKFRTTFSVKNRGRCHLVAKIASIYKDKALPVVPNLAIFYASFMPKYAQKQHIQKFLQEIKGDADYIDLYYPSLEYSKYFNCIKRHLNVKFWTKGLV